MPSASSRWRGASACTARWAHERRTRPTLHAAALAGRRIEAVVIGGSAGGVDALVDLLPALPRGYRLPVFCILHLPGDRESRLAELFDERLPLPVREAADKEDDRARHRVFRRRRATICRSSATAPSR